MPTEDGLVIAGNRIGLRRHFNDKWKEAYEVLSTTFHSHEVDKQ